MTDAHPHVLVIGGGLGGLCLAQGLKKAGISLAVYERDASPHVRRQGYRISINETGSQALRDCLPENLFNLCAATSIRQAMWLAVLDHHLRPKFVKPLPLPASASARFGVNRLTLREILLAGLDGQIRFDAALNRVERLEDGAIQAWFANGGTARGDLLVGADGTNSMVRRLLAPDAALDHLGAAIYGKTPITADTLGWLPDVLVDSFSRIGGPAGVAMTVATCRKREPLDAAVARLAPGLHLTEIHDYLMWMISLNEDARGADAPTLHALARDLIRDWHPALQRIIAEAAVADTFLVQIRSARPFSQWQSPVMTLLGDAAHTMSPGRGEGANTALRDAQVLCHRLVDVAWLGAPLADAKGRYEAEMLRYGFEAVAAAREMPFFSRSTPGGAASP